MWQYRSIRTVHYLPLFMNSLVHHYTIFHERNNFMHVIYSSTIKHQRLPLYFRKTWVHKSTPICCYWSIKKVDYCVFIWGNNNISYLHFIWLTINKIMIVMLSRRLTHLMHSSHPSCARRISHLHRIVLKKAVVGSEELKMADFIPLMVTIIV